MTARPTSRNGPGGGRHHDQDESGLLTLASTTQRDSRVRTTIETRSAGPVKLSHIQPILLDAFTFAFTAIGEINLSIALTIDAGTPSSTTMLISVNTTEKQTEVGLTTTCIQRASRCHETGLTQKRFASLDYHLCHEYNRE